MIGADRMLGNLIDEDQKTHVGQRYMRGFSDFDMWNFDVMLADLIVAGCDWHIKNSHTHPSDLDREEWEVVLSEIRDGFAKRKNKCGVPKPSKRVWKLLRDHYEYLWD